MKTGEKNQILVMKSISIPTWLNNVLNRRLPQNFLTGKPSNGSWKVVITSLIERYVYDNALYLRLDAATMSILSHDTAFRKRLDDVTGLERIQEMVDQAIITFLLRDTTMSDDLVDELIAQLQIIEVDVSSIAATISRMRELRGQALQPVVKMANPKAKTAILLSVAEADEFGEL